MTWMLTNSPACCSPKADAPLAERVGMADALEEALTMGLTKLLPAAARPPPQ